MVNMTPLKDDEVTRANETTGPDYFDRQRRISWWDQKRLSAARVLVVGAGALGNEVLKNLALLGVGHILVVDFDFIEDSNLSRTVLFRNKDATEGDSKASIAAKRVQELNPNPQAIVQAIHADVVWELGSGTFRYVDLVVGCVDNIEARLAVNLACWKASKSWIDGGMWELSGSVTVYDAAPDKACYECGMSLADYRRAKVRYSCTNETVKANIQAGREPATQTTSALVAAFQSQEAVKLLHGLPSFGGRQLILEGAPHFYTNDHFTPLKIINLTLNPDCLCHFEEHYKNVLELAEVTAHQTTARQLLHLVETKTGLIDLNLRLGRTFVVESQCPQCDFRRKIHRPLFRVRDVDTICPTCTITCHACGFVSVGQPDCPNCGQPDINEPRLVTFHILYPNDPITTPFLDYRLIDLGIPPLHILSVADNKGESRVVELSGDWSSPLGTRASS